MSMVIDRLQEMVNEHGFEYADIARILQTSPRTVSRWANEQVEPRFEVRERLFELAAVVDRLTQVVNDRAAQHWLFAPNADLGYEKPVELIQRGDFKKVLGSIDALGEGVFL
jgi:putative toxin-antitoxin system antitoxin component (TIGR02293 family)